MPFLYIRYFRKREALTPWIQSVQREKSAGEKRPNQRIMESVREKRGRKAP